MDGCGTSMNITNWQRLINMTGKPLLTENCHNEPDYATTSDGWCPMNFFRISSDINPSFVDIIGVNLAATMAYNKQYPSGFITRPGCWAYPDMLEVGNIQNQYNASARDMDQSHFNAWCVVSAPLILGFDLTNNQTMNNVWDIITNPETIAVSQNWAGTVHVDLINIMSEMKYLQLFFLDYPCTKEKTKKRKKQNNKTIKKQKYNEKNVALIS